MTVSGSGSLMSLGPLRTLMFRNLYEVGAVPEKAKHYAYIIRASDEEVITSIFVEIHFRGQHIHYVDALVDCLKDAGSDAEAEKVIRCYANSL